MPFATWWRGDPLPDLPPLPDFTAHTSTDIALLAGLKQASQQSIEARLRQGHLCYVASLDTTPVAYGWMATRQGGIDEFQFSFTIPPHNGYLWDFQTLPPWRGRGIYPHLLQEIIRQETTMERFWIGYEIDNVTSARGIYKAGLHYVGDIVISGDRVIGFTLVDESRYAKASAPFFNLPVFK